MINLIPINERLKQIKAYRVRFAIMFFSISLVAWLAGLVFLVPAYISAKSRISSVGESIKIAKSVSSAKGEGNLEFVIKEIQNRINILLSENKNIPPSQFLETIINDKPSGVRLTGFTGTDKGSGVMVLEVRGVASDRNSLLQFVQVLEKEEFFSRVEVPVSSFIEEKDLDFTFQIESKAKKS